MCAAIRLVLRVSEDEKKQAMNLHPGAMWSMQIGLDGKLR
jgi:hypothetical protein